MFTRCPKCGHAPLPENQALPAACPACGVILAKVAAAARHDAPQESRARSEPAAEPDEPAEAVAPAGGWAATLLRVPERVDTTAFWARVALLLAVCAWSLVLVRLDYRTGEFGESFLHRPLLVFHEAGHVVFGFMGEWIRVLGGTLGQLIMPLVMAAALLRVNRDTFGAALGLWFLGTSLLDVAPYMYDALHPQLMLLSGTTGEDGPHDWIYLFSSMGLRARSQLIGGLTHKAGAAVMLLALLWAAALLRRQHARLAGDVIHED